jgi:hypothetical protein
VANPSKPPQPPKLSEVGQPRRIDRATAWGYVLTNLVLPGLGTLLAGHPIAGVGQLLLSQTGFALMVAWAAGYLWNWIRAGKIPQEIGPLFNLSLLGMTLFFLTLLWSLASSLQILREARRTKE